MFKLKEELNTRPAQWLGFLKLLAATGAEYFYTGFFNLHPAFPDPRNWVWQGAAPAYLLRGRDQRIDQNRSE